VNAYQNSFGGFIIWFVPAAGYATGFRSHPGRDRPGFFRPRGPIRGEGSVGEGDFGRGGFRPPVTRADQTLCFVVLPRDRRRSCPADARAAGGAGGATGPRPTAGRIGNMVNPAGEGAAGAGAEEEPTSGIHSRRPESNRRRRDSGAVPASANHRPRKREAHPVVSGCPFVHCPRRCSPVRSAITFAD
jgi:hypothetical protein